MNYLTDPKILLLAGVGLVVVYLLMRNQGTTNNPNQFADTSVPTNSLTPQTASSGLNPVGGSYSYMDGTGMQHLIATDPYGNLVGYSNMPPNIGNPESGQLSSYVGSMSGQYLAQPYGGTTPYYSQAGYNIPNYMAPYTL